jgi:uncharacterized repeat protein (TIGR02543 family)
MALEKKEGVCLVRKVIVIIFLMVFFALVGCQKNPEVEIMFKTGGGTVIDAITSMDDLLEGLPSTTKEGYTFIGWFLDTEFTQPFDPLEKRDSWKITLHAKWEALPKDYQVLHYLQELNGSYTLTDTEDFTGVTDQEVTATPKTYVGFSVNHSREEAIPTLKLPASGEAVLKLYYDRNMYQIIIDEAGGNDVDDVYVKYGQTIVLPTVLRYGYAFNGWSTYPETMPAENINVTASWVELPQYNVSFDEMGGTVVADQLVYQGYLATKPADPVKVGYAFTGWYLESASSPFSFMNPITTHLELIARYVPIEVDYTTQYYIESLDGSFVLHQSVVSQALTESTVNANVMQINGFTEDSTHNLKIGSGTVLGDGSLLLKLYYTRNTYTIQFESNANLSIQSIQGLYEEAVTKPQDPIRTGYSFVGWFSDQALLLPYVFTTMPLGGITLYAKWQGQPTNLYFNSNGGSAVSMITAPLGDVIVEPNQPAREGYSFAGWYTDSNLTQAFTTWVMPSGGITLYAKWQANTYTITFEENGGSTVLDITQGYLTEVNQPLNPTKTDYLFAGWYSDLDLQMPYTFDVMPLGGITLYAKWISEEEGLTLSFIMNLDSYTAVEVKGTVLVVSTAPYQGFYLSDGTANIYVIFDQALVEEGLSYTFDAILIFEAGVPKLAHVTNLQETSNDYPLMVEALKTIDHLNDLPQAGYQSRSVEVEGILLDQGGYVLASTVDGKFIRISPQFGLGDVSTMLEQTVTIKGVLHKYQQGWILGVYDIALIGLTDAEKIDLIKAYIDRRIASSYEGMDTFKFFNDDPWMLSSLSMTFDLEDQAFYDQAHEMFIAVLSSESLRLTINITYNQAIYPYEKIITLHPRVYHTVLDVISGEEGVTYNLQGIIVMAQINGQVYVIKDETGELFITGQLDINYGDEVAIQLTSAWMNGMMIGHVREDHYLEVLSENNALNNDATPISLETLFAQGFTSQALFGDYLEIRGFLNEQGDIEFHGEFVVGNENHQLVITPISYQGYEALFGFADLEVIVRGYLYLNEFGQPALLFTGQRQDIKLPDYTDLERVEMILTLFSKLYAGHTFKSFEVFEMLPYHPVLGGHITWSFVEGENYYDQKTKMFGYVSEPTTIKIELTITQGSANRTYVYQTVLEGPEVLTIEGFKQLPDYDYAYVEGVVCYRNPDFMIIQDHTGLLLVYASLPAAYKGDRVVLYGKVDRDYSYQENVSMYRDWWDDVTIPLVVHISERGLTPDINATPMSLIALDQMNPSSPLSYNQFIVLEGYLEFDGWYFTISSGGKEVEFEAVDEYTMHKLAKDKNSFVSIMLWVDRYGSNQWDLTYLGMQGDIGPKEYTLLEKQTMVIDYVESIWGVPLKSDHTYTLPTTYALFNATMSYTILQAYQTYLHLPTGYISPTSVPLTIPLSVFITIDSITIEHVIQVEVLPIEIVEQMTIAEGKAELEKVISITGKIYATFMYDVNAYGLLIYDGSDYLIVKARSTDYFYSGTEIGQQGVFHGIMHYQNGRYMFETLSWTKSNSTLPLLSATPIALEEVTTSDHMFDPYLGQFVQISGRLERINWGYYELVVGHERIRIQTVYYQESELQPFIGYEVTLKGFMLGRSTYQESDQITLVMGYKHYDNSPNIVLKDMTDQEIADRVAEDTLRYRYDEPYVTGDYISLVTYHSLFSSSIISYSPLSHSELFVQESYRFVILHTEEDVEVEIEMTVQYGTATSTQTFVVFIKGFTYDTLDDLFDETVPFDEIDLVAIVIESQFEYAYFMIDGDVYYYEGFLGLYVDKGTLVNLHGKKSIIDGIVNYSFNVFVKEMESNETVNLIPRSMTLEDVYNIDLDVDDIRRDYLTLYGKLGYDSYLNYFYLDHNGYRIYIRHHLADYEPSSLGSTIMWYDGMAIYEMKQFIGESIYINVLFPNRYTLMDYLLVDFIGTRDDITLPTLTTSEIVDVVKDKVFTYQQGKVYQSGDDLNWMTYDYIREAQITYTLVNPSAKGINIDYMKAGIVQAATIIEVIATIEVFDGVTYESVVGTVSFTVTVKPIGDSTIYDVLYGGEGKYYLTKGIVQYIYPYYFMIIKDETGLIYVELPGESAGFGVFEEGDEVEVLGMRAHYEYEDYVPVISHVVDMRVISSDHVVDKTSIQMTVEDILALDYLDPGIFNQYIRFTGTVVFSGNYWYPSYDLREDGYTNQTYDLQLWGDTYDAFNTEMNPLVGQKITAYGYLIGFEYIYQAFDWIMHVDTFVVETE